MNRPAIAHKLPLGLVALFCLLALGAEVAEYQFFAHLKSEKKPLRSTSWPASVS